MESKNNLIKLLIADDHKIVRDGLAAIVKNNPDILLIGEAGNGRELVELVSALQPDIVLTDINMPEMNGIEATRIITRDFPWIGVIALSVFDNENMIVDMIKAGAKGYLLKSSGTEELLNAIKAVYNRQHYYYNAISQRLINYISRGSALQPDTAIAFSETEIEIIRLICEQYTCKEIASKLSVSHRSIEGYKERIQKKVGARNMIGIVIYAIKNHIYSVG